MDQTGLPSYDGTNGLATPNINKPESVPPQDGSGPTFDDPLEGTSASFSDPIRNVHPTDDSMKANGEDLVQTSPHLHEIAQKAGPGPGPGGDALECSEGKMAGSIEPIQDSMAEIDRTIKDECMQWTHVFMESEQFEMLSSNNVDKLLEDAKALEQSLIQQKERLLSHLKLLSQTLKLP